MKGIILAGGKGIRLQPLTTITNKHLLGVFDRPMILYPIETLKSLGVTEMLVVSSGDRIGSFAELLGDGSGQGVELTYRVQEEASGIADALLLAKNFVAGERFAMILGDNIFENERLPLEEIQKWRENGDSTLLVLKRVPEPSRFGVPEISDGKIVRIQEKPANPPSEFAVTGLYFYPADAFDVVPKLKPSVRGELEITDLNNYYIQHGRCSYAAMLGFWVDAGTTESLMAASLWAAERSGVSTSALAAAAKKQDPTFTVGIPTYYGGRSLVRAVESLRASEGVPKDFRLIVNVDGNPLRPEIRAELEELGVEIVFAAKRGGQAVRLNQILRMAETDLVVLTQDDIVFEPDALRKLIAAFERDAQLTMANANVMPAPGHTLIERVQACGNHIVKRIIERWRGSDNYLAANGRCQTFRTSWVKDITLPTDIVNSDAYKYFENRLRGGKFAYVRDAVVYDKSPLTIKEYVRQSRKFQRSADELKKHFATDLIPEYRIPRDISLVAAIEECVRHPLLMPLYIALNTYARFVTVPNMGRFWETDVSTKR